MSFDASLKESHGKMTRELKRMNEHQYHLEHKSHKFVIKKMSILLMTKIRQIERF
jgi:hypothetical protein